MQIKHSSDRIIGYYMKSTPSHSDYPPQAYELLVKAEPRHFWFRGRNVVIRTIIRRLFSDYVGKRFLEVGCGTGYVLAQLNRMGFNVTGLDMHPEGLVYAKKRVPEASFVRGSLAAYRPKTLFDAIGMFDVVEHIEDDHAALHQCTRLLKTGGMLFLTVPARPELWSAYDDISGHKRRYTKTTLTSLLNRSGYTIRYMSYVGFFQYLPHLIMKRFMLHKSGGKKTDVMSVLRQVVWQPPAAMNWMLEQSFLWDMAISKIMPLQVGTSLIVAAQKAV